MGAERRAGRTTEPQEAPVPPPERFPRAGRAGRAARGGAAEERRLGRSGPGAAGPRPPPRPGSAQDPPRASLSTTRTGTSAPSSTRPAPSRPAAHTRAGGRRRTSRTSRAPLGPPASPTRGAERRSRCAPSAPRARPEPAPRRRVRRARPHLGMQDGDAARFFLILVQRRRHLGASRPPAACRVLRARGPSRPRRRLREGGGAARRRDALRRAALRGRAGPESGLSPQASAAPCGLLLGVRRRGQPVAFSLCV